MNEEPARFPVDQLITLSKQVFQQLGVPPRDAAVASEVLSASDLRGIESHGIVRLPIYAKYLKNGQTNPRPNIRVVRENPSSAAVDGDNGLGLVVGPAANEIAMTKAASVGTGWVSVRHSNHFGIAGYYPLQALQRDMIGWAMTNGSRWVAPLWGSEKRLGTNPIAIAFPGKSEPPIVIDMATSAVAYGKVQLARLAQTSIPTGWGLDEAGESTTDPERVHFGGSLLPLGSDRVHGGHKGYCLGSMVDILCGTLSGANWGPFVPPFVETPFNAPDASVGKGIGHFFGAMQIDGFIDADEFKGQIDHWVRTFRATKAAPGTDGPLIPGDPERAAEADRRQNGIPLAPNVVAQLSELATELQLDFPGENS